jgi:O-antigen/teichoic acid export membrane protein
VRLGFGFIFWLLAARFYALSDVGLAASATAATILCGLLALLGSGSSIIKLYPSHRQSPLPLVFTAASIVFISAILVSGAFVALTRVAFSELSVISSPSLAIIFVSLSTLNGLSWLSDELSIAMKRNVHVLARAGTFGVMSLSALLFMSLLPGDHGARTLVAAWLVGAAGAFALGVYQVSRVVGRSRTPAPRVAPARLLKIGLPNHALTLADATPIFVLPLLVTEVLSPEANAVWYVVSMAALGVYLSPMLAGITLFAEAADPRADVPAALKFRLKLGLVLGGTGALLIAALASTLLNVLGDDYAADGTTPLRILLIGTVPVAFSQAFFALSRARGSLLEPTLLATGGALAVLACAAIFASTHGLTGVACAWVGVQLVIGFWSAWRLRAFMQQRTARVMADDARVGLRHFPPGRPPASS